MFLMCSVLVSQAQEKIKVACVGNSITANAKVEDGKKYPDVLQKMLGDTYEVKNYGLGGRTLLKKGNRPYWNEAKYNEVKEWQPDVVIIKLGTNDSKLVNWQYKNDFLDNYVEFINSFEQLKSNPKIFICYPLPSYEKDSDVLSSAAAKDSSKISGVVIKNEILPLIDKISKKTNTQLIDLYTPFVGKSSFLYDGVHPNADGTALMAQVIYTDLFKSVANIKSDSKYYVRMADSEMKRNPEGWMLDFSKVPKWNYCHGLELQSILQVWQKTGDKKYFDYAETYADSMINDKGEIKSYKLSEYNIDRVNTGKILFPLYKATQNEKYKKAMELLREQMKTHPRTSDGGFWHKKVYPNQMWLDGLYMASPFLAEYAATFDEPALFDDVALQITTVAKHTYDAKTGLYYHGWDESKTQQWANPQTGQSPNFWSRSIGWYMMAMVDVLDYLPTNHPQRSEIIKILQNLSASIEKFQDPKEKLWYQVTDRVGEKGNYLESTGSAMFIYTWKKGAEKGYLDKSYKKKSEEAYASFVKNFIITNLDGTISVTNCCAVAGLGGTPYRSGTYEYYISEPVRYNDPKAVAPFIMVSILFNK